MRKRLINLERNKKIIEQDDLGRSFRQPNVRPLVGGSFFPKTCRKDVQYTDLGSNNVVYSEVFKKRNRGLMSAAISPNSYYNMIELNEINKRPSTAFNFTKKPPRNNISLKFTGEPEIFKSVLDVFDDDTNKQSLTLPKTKTKRKNVKFGGQSEVIFTEEVKDAFQKSLLTGGGKSKKKKFDSEKFGKNLANVSIDVLSSLIKIGGPELSKSIGVTFGLNATASKLAGKVISNVLADKLKKLKFGKGSKLGTLTSNQVKELGLSVPSRPIKGRGKKKDDDLSSFGLSQEQVDVLKDIMREALLDSLSKRLGGGKKPQTLFKGKFKTLLKKGLKSSKKVLETIGPVTLKAVLPVVLASLGQSAGIPAPVTLTATGVIGSLVSKELFGKGVSRAIVEIEKPDLAGSGISKILTSRQRRSNLIKKIMKSEGLSLPLASSFIKRNALKY